MLLDEKCVLIPFFFSSLNWVNSSVSYLGKKKPHCGLKLTEANVFFLQVTLSLEQQPKRRMESPAADRSKNKLRENNNADTFHAIETTASDDLQKDKGSST